MQAGDDVAAHLLALLRVPVEIARLSDELRSLRAEVAALRDIVPPAVVSVPEAAKRLGVSLSTMRRLVRDGGVGVVRVGRSVRVDLSKTRAATDDDVARMALAAREGADSPRRRPLRAIAGRVK